jgi:hypothetical protein
MKKYPKEKNPGISYRVFVCHSCLERSRRIASDLYSLLFIIIWIDLEERRRE